jgi:hypothetical protein
MEPVATIAILALGALVLFTALAAVAVRAKRRRLIARLGQGPSGQDRTADLPPLVVAYARRAGATAEPGLIAVAVDQAAEIRQRRGGLLLPVAARQILGVGRAGFVWQARRGRGPFTRFRRLEALIEGDGLSETRLFGAIPVQRSRDVETTLGQAYRYLADLPWAPDAILGNPDLSWRMARDDLAEVKLETRGGTARVAFRFDAAGDIVAVEARDRPARDGKGNPVRYDWRGQYGDYGRIGSRRLPAYGEIGWVYPDGYEVCFRCRVRDCRPA